MDLVCVLQTSDHFLAMSAKEILEENGIICVVQNEHLIGTMPFYDLATAGMKLLVDETKAVRAVELIEALQAEVAPEVAETAGPLPYDSEKFCPHCHHTRISVETVPRRGLAVLFAVLFGLSGKLNKRVNVCDNCGHRW